MLVFFGNLFCDSLIRRTPLKCGKLFRQHSPHFLVHGKLRFTGHYFCLNEHERKLAEHAPAILSKRLNINTKLLAKFTGKAFRSNSGFVEFAGHIFRVLLADTETKSLQRLNIRDVFPKQF